MDEIELRRDYDATRPVDEKFLALSCDQSEAFMEIIGAVELQGDNDFSGAIDKAPFGVFLDREECLRCLSSRLRSNRTHVPNQDEQENAYWMDRPHILVHLFTSDLRRSLRKFGQAS